MSNLGCPRPRPRLELAVVRVVDGDRGHGLVALALRPEAPGRLLPLHRKPVTAKVPALDRMTRMMRPTLMLPPEVLRVVPAALVPVVVRQVALLQLGLRRLR